MDIFNIILSIVGLLGIGSSITIVVQYILEGKKQKHNRLYEEKKKCILEFHQCYAALNLAHNKLLLNNYAASVFMVKIFCSEKTTRAIEYLNTTNPNSPERDNALSQLIEVFKEELTK